MTSQQRRRTGDGAADELAVPERGEQRPADDQAGAAAGVLASRPGEKAGITEQENH